MGTWKKADGTASVKAYVPLEYDPGDAFQFDWSYEQVELGGIPVGVKIAHFRLLLVSHETSVQILKGDMVQVVVSAVPKITRSGGMLLKMGWSECS